MFSDGAPMARSGDAGTVEIADRQRPPELVRLLGPAGYTGTGLAPQLIPGRCQAAGDPYKTLTAPANSALPIDSETPMARSASGPRPRFPAAKE